MKKTSAILAVIIIILVGLIYWQTKHRPGTTSTPETKVNFFDRPASTDTPSTTPPSTEKTAPTSPRAQKDKIQALETNLQSPTNYNELAVLYYRQGDKNKAIEILNEGLAKNPNDKTLLQTKDLITYLWPNL